MTFLLLAMTSFHFTTCQWDHHGFPFLDFNIFYRKSENNVQSINGTLYKRDISMQKSSGFAELFSWTGERKQSVLIDGQNAWLSSEYLRKRSRTRIKFESLVELETSYTFFFVFWFQFLWKMMHQSSRFQKSNCICIFLTATQRSKHAVLSTIIVFPRRFRSLLITQNNWGIQRHAVKMTRSVKNMCISRQSGRPPTFCNHN